LIPDLARHPAVNWFPSIATSHLTHSCGVAFGIPLDRTPTIKYDRANGVATGRGDVGVGASNLAGRLLADLMTETGSELSRLPIMGHRSRNWEPEPVRLSGITIVRHSLARTKRKAERLGRYLARLTTAQRFWRA
jgi:glycine/D-amino acid oxidase-like deaminating enzyme